ncbi:MAG: hypothetical protein IKR60_03675 [Alphaproteobacteria bacterium]|nr:hypothetical protein [Alphaproteobacteria bacterium]
MKKLLLSAAFLGLAACTTTHQGTKSLNVDDLTLKARPLQVSVVPGEKISGTVECTNFLGIPIRYPSKEAYGARLETSSGNFAGDNCTRGAIYNAIVNSNADVILAPQYMTSGKTFLCLPLIGCLYNNRTITVTGYKGTYQDIREMPEHVIQQRFSVPDSEPTVTQHISDFFK